MTDLQATKKMLRKHFLQIRKELSQVSCQKKSQKIIDRIFSSSEFEKAFIIHTYIPSKKNREVDTFPLIKKAFIEGKKVIVPKISGEGELEHIELTSTDELEKNHLGIPEPSNGKTYPISKLDLVIVPMVAGDLQKNRLGYGKGYYDRFLEKCPAIKMGLLFDCQLYENKLPVESFDIPLDILVTESQRIE